MPPTTPSKHLPLRPLPVTFHYRFLWLSLVLASPYLTTLPACAQQAPAATPPAVGTGSITGIVLDSAARQPVSYATVVLLPPAPEEKAITGVAADDEGRFSIAKLTPGAYRLRISYVGYATRTQAVTVTDGATNVGTLRLAATAQQLAEAVVIGSKPVVEVRPDRLVYNADQDVTNSGGTAADVLRKAPLLSVDGEGNVKMRGSGNFKVLVNNKPSPTLAQNLAEALKSIPADQIQSVEVITTPPAKYDGEGTAGIINIVLKKGVNQHVNGRVSATTGNRNTNLNGSLNFRQGKVGFTSSASVGRWYNPGEFSRARTTFNAETGTATSWLNQHATIQNDGGWYYGTVGVDYDPVEHHSLSLASSLNGWGGTTDTELTNQLVANDVNQSRLFTRATGNRFTGTNAEVTGTYTRTFAQARREWSVLGQYANNSSTFGYDFDEYRNSLVALEPARSDYRERSRGRAPGHEITAQTDFVQPFGDKQTLEVGLKSIWRHTGSVAVIDSLTPSRTTEFAEFLSRRTDFSYDQNVQAAYGTYSFGVGKKVKFSLGSRLERTVITADFRTTESGFSRDYITPLPNGNVQYAFSDATSLRLAYSRRITRPYIDFLNPYIDRSDPSTIQYGNPNLDPELTDSYELSYNTSIKTASLSVSGSVRHTGNAIEQVRLPTAEANVTAQTFANVATNTFYQLNLYGSVKPTPKWDISGGPDVQYITRRSPQLNASRSGFTAGLNLNTSYKLPKSFTVQGFVFAGLPSPAIQGKGSANLYYQFGAKKTFWKDKADLNVNLSNPFSSYWPYRNTTTTAYFEERDEFRAYQRAIRVSFGYRFGQQQGGRQRKQISNDDVKGGGSKQGGGQ